MEFDVVGNQTGRTVFLGAGGEQRSTYMAYDAANRQVDVTDALGGVAASKFDQAGNTVQVLDQVGRPTYFGFDKLNRQTTRTNALGNTWTTVFNSRGLVSSEADPESRLLEMTYDRLGRTTHRNNSLGEISYFGFDARSNQVVTVNPRGNATYFTFDRLDRTSHREDQLGGVRYFGFDAVGNQVLQLDELENPTYFFHDGLRRVDRSMDALFKSTYFEYDARGGLVKRASAAVEAGTTYMSYDAAARLESQWFASTGTPDKPIYFAYDQVSNLTSADDSLAGIGITTNEFDKLDRLTKKHNLGGAVYYQYDASSQRIELKNPDLVKTNYVIDKAGRTWQVSMSGPEGVTRSYYEYDDADLQITKVLPSNAVISYYHHDDAGRLQTLKNLDSSLAVINYFHHDRNENGAIERIQHEAGKWTYYAFDALDRLTDERQHTNPQVYRKTYVYDAASNRTTKAETIAPSSEVFTFYDYNAANLLEEERIGSTSANYFAYDNSQRRNALWTSGSEATYFDHNQRDQIGGLRFVGTGDTDHSWSFTGTGERALMVGGQGGTTPTYLAYDGDQLLTERDENDFVYGSYRQGRLGDPYGDLLGVDDQEAGALLYPTLDQWGSVKSLVGATGEAEYDLFGVPISDDIASTVRSRFVSPLFSVLNTTQDLSLASGAPFLPAGMYQASLGPAGFVPGLSNIFFKQGGLPLGPDWYPDRPDYDWFTWYVRKEVFGSIYPPPVDPREHRRIFGPPNRETFPPKGWKDGRYAPPPPFYGPPADETKYCGANVDAWLSRELTLQVTRARAALGLRPDIVDYLHWALMNQRYKDKFYFQFSRGSKKCARKKPCGFSVTVCGICVTSAALGNIVYGYVGQRLKIGSGTLVKAPGAFKRMYFQNVDPNDKQSYRLGNYLGMRTGPGAPPDLKKMGFCQHFKDAAKTIPRGLQGPPKECKPCTDPTQEKRHGGNEPWGPLESLKKKFF